MPSRSRLKFGPLVQGFKVKNSTGVATAASYRSSKDECDDVTGQGDNHLLTVKHTTQSGGLIYGNTGQFGNTWLNYPCTYQVANPNAVTHLSLPALDYPLLASSVLKRTSPNRSSMESLVSLAELRELPGMVKDSMDFRLKNLFRNVSRWGPLSKLAKLNLMIQFGVLPMVQDAQTLLNMSHLVDARVRELERLRTRGLRRTVFLQGDSSIFDEPSVIVHSNDAIIRGTLHRRTIRQVKGHVRWTLLGNHVLADDTLRALAQKVVSGMVLDPATLYELLPWSWLIDYFTNLGDFVALNRNTIPVSHSNPTFSVHTKTEITSSSHTYSNNARITSFKNSYETKLRTAPMAASLAARMTFLTARQTSILGSLAILRDRRR